MRRLATLLLVSSVLIGVAPAVAAAEECGEFVIRADFEGSLLEGLSGAATLWMDGEQLSGDLAVTDNFDGTSNATYSFGDVGSFTTFDVDTVLFSQTMPGLVFLGFTAEVVDGDGAFEGATGTGIGRGHFMAEEVDDDVVLSNGSVRVVGELCFEGNET